jgi:Ammonia permease
LVTQLIGIGAVAAFVLTSAAVMFTLIKFTVGLRASDEAEILGLDIVEHGLVNYPEFTNSPSVPVLSTADASRSGRVGAATTASAPASGD